MFFAFITDNDATGNKCRVGLACGHRSNWMSTASSTFDFPADGATCSEGCGHGVAILEVVADERPVNVIRANGVTFTTSRRDTDDILAAWRDMNTVEAMCAAEDARVAAGRADDLFGAVVDVYVETEHANDGRDLTGDTQVLNLIVALAAAKRRVVLNDTRRDALVDAIRHEVQETNDVLAAFAGGHFDDEPVF